MPITLETRPPIAGLSVQDAGITGGRKFLHRYLIHGGLLEAPNNSCSDLDAARKAGHNLWRWTRQVFSSASLRSRSRTIF
jgi:hypothetical protein